MKDLYNQGNSKKKRNSRKKKSVKKFLFILKYKKKLYVITKKKVRFVFNLTTYRAYSCGNGLEYHVSISHLPKSMAAGQRSWAANAIEDGDIKCGLIPAACPPTAKFNRPPGFITSATALAACSRISLYKSTSFWVTHGGNGCVSKIK